MLATMNEPSTASHYNRARQMLPAYSSSRQHTLLLGAADALFKPITSGLSHKRPFYSGHLNSEACFYISEMF